MPWHNSRAHHALSRTWEFPDLPKGPELAGCAVGAVVSAETNSGVEEISAELSLALKSRFPETETLSGRDTVRMCGYAVSSPSIWR